MSLSAGDKLGPYEILGLIGAGGMGEVYRARDPRLGRDVAVKVSAERFSERFEREARVIASLNHPNICHLYDVGPNYLVMELVEGESPKGPVPLETAMNYGRQIASALGEAHEKGITHRDLKPGNIKIKPDGTVKVLDFGLAKVAPASAGSGENSPTLSMAATQVGMILGTAGYMSPEQARGKTVDKRADIWAFGVVLYELLTGKRLFQGEDVTETLAAVVMKEPDLSAAPAQVRRVLQKCLEKDPKNRLRDIGDAWELLEETPPVVPAAARLPWLAAGLCAALAAVLAFLYFRQPPRPADSLTRLELALPVEAAFQMQLSPDGHILTFAAPTSDGKPAIWARPLDSAAAPRMLQGTEGTNGSWFFSPDSRFIAFTADGELKKIDVAGGPPTTIAKSEYTAQARGGSWNRDDVLIFGSPWGIVRVALADGKASLLTEVVGGQELDHIQPFFLPDGRHFVYSRSGLGTDAATLFAGSLDNTPQQQPAQPMGATMGGGPGNQVYYFPARNPQTVAPGFLMFRRDGTVVAQPFDPDTLRLSGNVTPVSESSVSSFTAAPGVLVYKTGTDAGASTQLTWYDRLGKPVERVGAPAEQSNLRISPDGTQVAVERGNGRASAVWILNFATDTTAKLSSESAGFLGYPVWSPDGTKVLFSAMSTNSATKDSASAKGLAAGFPDLYLRAAGGTGVETLLLKNAIAGDWSRDGVILIGRLTITNGRRSLGLFTLRVKDGKADGEASPYLANPNFGQSSVVSPDSHWVAYESNESGKGEIYVSSFPDATRFRNIISAGGGTMPRWSRDGRELFYISPDNSLMTVPVTAGASFQAGKPKALFTAMGRVLGWDVAPNGRFLLNLAAAPSTANPVQGLVSVVSNWQTALRQ